MRVDLRVALRVVLLDLYLPLTEPLQIKLFMSTHVLELGGTFKCVMIPV